MAKGNHKGKGKGWRKGTGKQVKTSSIKGRKPRGSASY